MSDNWIQFVPSDPEYQPSPQAAERARVLFAAFTPHAEESRPHRTPRVLVEHAIAGISAYSSTAP
jgi:hypothetical protein